MMMNEVFIISQWVIFCYLVLARKRKQFSFRFCNSKAVLRGENLLLTLFLWKLCCTGPLFSESSLHSLRLPRQWGLFTSLRGAWGWKLLLLLLLLLLLVTQLGPPPSCWRLFTAAWRWICRFEHSSRLSGGTGNGQDCKHIHRTTM